jgi:two-component system response regulator RegA
MNDKVKKISSNNVNRLLLVDDDLTFCQVLSRALYRKGYEVLLAYDLPRGLVLAEREGPRYAVIDLRIGKESGLILLERLAQLTPKMRMVVLTGYASIATAVEAIKLGATHYLTKPTDTDEIVTALHRDECDAAVPLPEHPLSVRRLEWEHLQKVLMEHGGNISASARALRMHRRTLQRKLNKRPLPE